MLVFIKELKADNPKAVANAAQNFENMMKRWDADGNKKVDRGEFKTRMKQYLKNHPKDCKIMFSGALQKYRAAHIGGLPKHKESCGASSMIPLVAAFAAGAIAMFAFQKMRKWAE